MGICKKSELTGCELVVMKIIWDAKQPITCQEIIRQLSDKYGMNYKETTVYTFLKKLKDKGFVDSYRKGITFFMAVRTEEEYRNMEVIRFCHFWYMDQHELMIKDINEIGNK